MFELPGQVTKVIRVTFCLGLSGFDSHYIYIISGSGSDHMKHEVLNGNVMMQHRFFVSQAHLVCKYKQNHTPYSTRAYKHTTLLSTD